MGRVLAAADIGSNTVHLLIAEADANKLARIDNRSEWVSLGEQVARHGYIPADQAEHLRQSLVSFKRAARSAGAEYLYIFATEAMRAAENHEEILEDLRIRADLVVDLISPRREVELSLRGVMLDSPADTDLLIEVGGGSAQIARIHEHKITDTVGLPLGTGRVIAEAGLKNPSSTTSILSAERFIDAHLDQIGLSGPTIKRAVASGGVIRGFLRALHRDNDHRLHLKELEYMKWVAATHSVSTLVKRFDVKQKRAATLLPGSLVYSGLMRRFGIEEVFVSEFGVREGAIMEIFKGSIQGCLV